VKSNFLGAGSAQSLAVIPAALYTSIGGMSKVNNFPRNLLDLLRRLFKSRFRKSLADQVQFTNIESGGHPMSFTDKQLQCADCGKSFTFTSSEQEFFSNKGFTNEPKRCPDCRTARKQERGGGSRSSYGSSGSRRQMYPAVCATCGANTEVPFEPRQDRPVYCSQCYSSQGGGSQKRR
jgi:CxxC-x17-CxxC domain-containing protein